jgi:hypothetical protein
LLYRDRPFRAPIGGIPDGAHKFVGELRGRDEYGEGLVIGGEQSGVVGVTVAVPLAAVGIDADVQWSILN